MLCDLPAASTSDACAAPPHCIAGAAQCSAEPQRWAMRTRAHSAPNVSSLRPAGTHPDWGVLEACPHLHGDGTFATPACWDQIDGTQKGASTLLFSSSDASHTSSLPTTFSATCGSAPVAARFQ